MNSEPPNSVLLSIYDYSFVSIYIIVLDTKIGHANYEKVPIWAIEIVILLYKLGLFYLFLSDNSVPIPGHFNILLVCFLEC